MDINWTFSESFSKAVGRSALGLKYHIIDTYCLYTTDYFVDKKFGTKTSKKHMTKADQFISRLTKESCITSSIHK